MCPETEEDQVVRRIDTRKIPGVRVGDEEERGGGLDRERGRIDNMCHLILLLPVLGLPLFWVLPLGYALPINIALWLISAFLYRLIRKAMMKPVQDGFQSLIGTEAEVVSKQTPGHSAPYLVRSQGAGELWSAYSTDVLDIGEQVKIVAVRGIGVVVERAKNSPGYSEVDNEEAKLFG